VEEIIVAKRCLGWGKSQRSASNWGFGGVSKINKIFTFYEVDIFENL